MISNEIQPPREIPQDSRVPSSQSYVTPTERVERKAILGAMWTARGQLARVRMVDDLTEAEAELLLEWIAEDAAEKAGV